MRWPCSTNSGTWMTAPVSSVAGLVPPPETESPRTPGIGLGDLEVDGARQLDVRGLVVDEQHLDLAARLAPAQRVGDRALGDRDLLEGLRVHEVGVAAVRVQELHLA